MTAPDIRVEGTGHQIDIDPTARLDGTRIRVRGDNATLIIGANVQGAYDITVGRGGSLFIGPRTSAGSALLVALGGALHIGGDCMLSYSIEIRTTDTHAIYDVASGERINPDRDVHIGDHVWLGKQVTVLKGARIGAGSIVGTRSLVSGELPELSVSAGTPARVLRTGVTWTRHLGTENLYDDDDAMAVVTAIASQ